MIFRKMIATMSETVPNVKHWVWPFTHITALFWGALKSLQMMTAAMKLKDAYSLEAKESIPSNCGSGEDAWESLSSKKIKEIKPVNPKGTRLWIFIGSTDSEASVFWPPPWKSWLIGRDPDARKDWGQGENGVTWWDGWMASLTRWTGVWASSRSWWWTGKPGMLQSMGSQSQMQLSGRTTNWFLHGIFLYFLSLLKFLLCL